MTLYITGLDQHTLGTSLFKSPLINEFNILSYGLMAILEGFYVQMPLFNA